MCSPFRSGVRTRTASTAAAVDGSWSPASASKRLALLLAAQNASYLLAPSVPAIDQVGHPDGAQVPQLLRALPRGPLLQAVPQGAAEGWPAPAPASCLISVVLPLQVIDLAMADMLTAACSRCGFTYHSACDPDQPKGHYDCASCRALGPEEVPDELHPFKTGRQYVFSISQGPSTLGVPPPKEPRQPGRKTPREGSSGLADAHQAPR